MLLLGLSVDPIVLRFQTVTVGREWTSDCTRLPFLHDLPVLLPLILHHPVDPIQPGRPMVGLQPGRSETGLPVVGLPSGEVHQKVPQKVPLFLPCYFLQSLFPPSPGRRPFPFDETSRFAVG